MAGKGTGLDVGSHSIKAIGLRAGRHGVQVARFTAVPAEEGGAELARAGMPVAGATVGLAGRDMNLRYSQVPPTPDWQLKNLMDLEIQDLAQQSGGALSADYNLLPPQDEEAGVDTVLLALAKDDALERLRGETKAAGGSVAAFTPNCIALYNAYLKCGPVEPDAVVCLANLGHETIDIALVKGTDLLFARNLSGGGKVLDDAIAAAFNVSPRKAETLKRDLLDLDPQSRGRYATGQAEKVTMAAGGAAGAITAAIQSSLAFCKAQTKIADLRLDKVLVAGGSARLRGLRGMLRESLRCPVELFDPFANVDLSALPQGDAEQLQAMRYEAVVALGLAAAQVDDTLYSLEILPADVRRKQRFQQRTIWNVAAGAIGVALLALYAKDRMAAVQTAEDALRRAQRQVAQIRSVHEEAAELIEANKQDRALVEHLAAQAVPLHGALRSLRAVTAHLPPQLWIKKVEVTKKTGGSAKGPTIEIEGAGKEIDGVEVGRVLQDFSQRLRNDPLLIHGENLTSKMPPSTGSTVPFTFTIEFKERG